MNRRISLSIYTHPYSYSLPTKNISITKEAYDALQREKTRNDESFTEIILRLTRRTGRMSDSFGAWGTMTDREEAKFERELSRGWKRSSENFKKFEVR